MVAQPSGLRPPSPGVRAGDNDNAFLGGFLLWDQDTAVGGSTAATSMLARAGRWINRSGLT